MTQPPRVRAVARVAEQPTGLGPASIRARRQPGRIGPLHAVQLVVVEVVVLALVALVARGPVVLGGTALAGVVLIAFTLARHRGRWWLESRMLRWEYRRRHRVHPARRGRDDPRLRALRALAPGLSVTVVPGPDGTRVGVARDEAGWFAVAAVKPAAAMRDEPADALPIDRLVRVVADAGHPGAVLQVLTHTVATPSVQLEPRSPAEQSYRLLLEASAQVAVPGDRVTWIAVRLDARALAEEGVAGADDADPAGLAATLIRRVVSTLRRTGRACQILDAEGLVSALARSCDLDPDVPDGSARETREDWAAWHSGPLAHCCFWVRHWPPVVEIGALLHALTAVPAALSSVALILTPDGDEVDLRCLVRVAAPADRLAHVCHGLVRAAEQLHADLFRLDGEHGPAVYATAPTGGGPG